MVFLGLPSELARRAILDLYLRNVDHEADLSALAADTQGLSGADLREVVRSAVLDAHSSKVEQNDLIAALDRMLPTKEQI